LALKVVTAPAVAANTPFVIIVPGQETWRVISIVGVCSRAAGGIPNRSFQLAVGDATRTVVVTPAADAGTEPGTCTVTWCNGNPAAVSAGATGVSLGPLPNIDIPPGYRLTGSVLSGTVTDQWTSALAWVDYRVT
jgi:hypothetical protein